MEKEPQPSAKEEIGIYGEEETRLFDRILNSRRTEIDGHEYACVIGDDKSARKPALIVGRALNTIYKKRNEEPVPLLFIDPKHLKALIYSANYDNKKLEESEQIKYDALLEKAAEFVRSHGVTKGKILLITDFVNTGAAQKVFEDIAKKLSLDIEIVANPKWYSTSRPRQSEFRSGLQDNPDTESLFARPFYEPIQTHEQADMQLGTIADNLPLGIDTTSWNELLEEAGFSKENYWYYRNYKNVKDSISLDLKKNLVRILKPFAFDDNRKDVSEFVDFLANRYVKS